MKRIFPSHLLRKYPLIGLLVSLLLFAYPMVMQEKSKSSLSVPVATSSSSMVPEVTEVVVKRVIDGDTIELRDGNRVRYIGINTPEISRVSTKICYGKEATRKNAQLVEGKVVRMVKDISETDKYGRLLRYVYVDDMFVNEELLKQGFAQVSTYPPDVAYKDVFLAAEKVARDKKLGLWGAVCASPSTDNTMGQ